MQAEVQALEYHLMMKSTSDRPARRLKVCKTHKTECAFLEYH